MTMFLKGFCISGNFTERILRKFIKLLLSDYNLEQACISRLLVCIQVA